MKVELTSEGALFELQSSLEAWMSALPIQAASALNTYLSEKPQLAVTESLHVPAYVVTTWSSVVTEQLGLPPNTPLGFDVRLSGAMGKTEAQINIRWLQPGKTIPARDVICNGPWMEWRGKTYRLNSPFFEVMGYADEFNRTVGASIEEQFRIWGRIRAALGDTNASQLTDGFLRTFRVVTANALTFSIRTDEQGDVQLDPVLLTSRREDSGENLTHDRALTEADEVLFPRRLDQLREGVPAFPLSQGTYVVADEQLQKTLGAIRQLRKAPPEQRKRAAMYPEAVIRELLGAEESEPTVFIETERFAERVRDVGEWTAPILPWIKIAPQQWGGTATPGVRLNGVDIPLDGELLAKAISEIRSAVASGNPSVEVAGHAIPATTANAAALEQLQRALVSREAAAEDQEPASAQVKNVLIIETNFEEASFTRTCLGRRAGEVALPGGLRSVPKKHQEIGLAWLQRHWIEGSRGALLCDDMGLGKTFQALAFCLWLRELMEAGAIEKQPLLIVAPVGLLRNWEAEIEEHLFPPGLGDVIRAYGEHLKGFRRGRHTDGTAGLDTARLSSANVVLANYEAVSDYQLSFGAVPFAAVILDEVQKIKSPKSRMTHAVKALNVDYVLAMTGTPVENRLADLWCIADAVQPGALADLKEFSAKYEVEGADVAGLRQQVWQEEKEARSEAPKLLLRRLKTEKLDGLPEKHEHVIKMVMPQRQAEAYGRALAMKEISGPEGTLGMIHALRRVSLHPALMEGGVNEDELRVEDSARFIAMMQVLDNIADKNEKVLVFLESLDLQDATQLPLLLQRRYKLARPPMVINGQVSTESRQERVNTFQREAGFDIMLLSPKAGGVGLTLTAANHVIHLSRWWNPAVEDQCSDRVYRIGQTKPVHIYYPLALLQGAEEHSFDHQLQLLMTRKRSLAQNLLAAPAFTKQDYAELLAGTVA